MELISKSCAVCGREFTTKNKRQVTCLSPVCVKKRQQHHNKVNHKKYQGKYQYQHKYQYNKNEGLTLSAPQKKRIQSEMTFDEWNALTVAERWTLMTWEQVDAECLRLHISSYGKAQVMVLQGTMPDEFGKRKVEDNG